MSQQRNLEHLVNEYIDTKLIPKNPNFNNMSICPYVARYRSQIRITVAHQSFTDVIHYAYRTWREDDVCWVYAFETDDVPGPNLCSALADNWADDFYKKGATLLLDHPAWKERINGVYTGFGEGVLLVIQNTSILQRSRHQLFKTAYYAGWTDDQKRELVD